MPSCSHSWASIKTAVMQRRSQLRDHFTDWVQSSGEAGVKIHSGRGGKSTFVTETEAQIIV